MRITFFDTELDTTFKIKDLGALYDPDFTYRGGSVSEFLTFLKGSDFICGHNIFAHDLKPLEEKINNICPGVKYIDTLYLSPLLFPKKPYHNLVKDDKLQHDELNNPLNDAKKASTLFYDCVATWHQLDPELQSIFAGLLFQTRDFSGFFSFLQFARDESIPLSELIFRRFEGLVCERAPLDQLINVHPVELAYCLALIDAQDNSSIPPLWVARQLRDVKMVMHKLRSIPCLEGCMYCNRSLDIHKGLERFFGYTSFRMYGGVPLQENAVRAAMQDKSLLAIFPTGGGKSLTFQLPALLQGEANKGLTVIISPLQSLMKDQVDNLEKKGIVNAVAINGLLDPIERTNAFDRVATGGANLLYISPESLRSKSIEHLLLGRVINRFVIDEAHCFSAWGHDFRVDYLYIADFISALQVKKNLSDPIPVSCFTATAKPQVIEDIRDYFLNKLDLHLEVFQTDAQRTNLAYQVSPETDDRSKYESLRNILCDDALPAIVYVSRTKKTQEISDKLCTDGLQALPFHGKLDSKTKTQNQNKFIDGEIPIMVATSAFGMGVDKKDVRTVVHYEISDSLENYVQEAGRAGRDEGIQANCHILFNEDDLDKHFILQNNTRITHEEIRKVWKSVKDLTRFRTKVSKSALDIARQAGWDESVNAIETRVVAAIAALEEAGYLERSQNASNIYATSFQFKKGHEAMEKINASQLFAEEDKSKARLIISKLAGDKRKALAQDDELETRVDYLADRTSMSVAEVIRIVGLLRQEGILANDKDLTAFIRTGENESNVLRLLVVYQHIISNLLVSIQDEKKLSLKQFQNELNETGNNKINIREIRNALLFLGIKNWIKFRYINPEKTVVYIESQETVDAFSKKTEMLYVLGPVIINYLIRLSKELPSNDQEQVLVHFSEGEILKEIERVNDLQANTFTFEDIEDTLFFLSKIDAIDIEGGFLVLYKRMAIEINEARKKEQFKKGDYEKLDQFYDQKMQQVHIVGAYAKKMIDDYKGALTFVDDYFTLNYDKFLDKYFPGSTREEINRTITNKKFRQLFGDLSPTQLEIINDQKQQVAVLAGPGSGKTRILVHKLAAVVLMEKVKHEEVLMLTFSRSAVTEFKKRLYGLIGNAAAFIEIKTFHSFCFSLMGKSGDLESSKTVVGEALEAIRKEKTDRIKLTRSILLIDEAQDINSEEYELILELIKENEGLRVIMVGDDDQNIFEFRGSDSSHLKNFITVHKITPWELVENFRSSSAIVEFSNRFVSTIKGRLKETPIISRVETPGSVSLSQHVSDHLIVPLVDHVQRNDRIGITGVLTRTNEEAGQVVCLLNTKGINSHLIQSNEGFVLTDLEEIRFILNEFASKGDLITIPAEIWQSVKSAVRKRYQRTLWIDTVLNLMDDFEKTNRKGYYLSDFYSYIRESKSEDFRFGSSQAIWVSTYHKAKGKEFDNVFILFNVSPPYKDEFKRALYVAMTRAKHHLHIHTKGNNLQKYATRETEITNDENTYSEPEQFSVQLAHDDVMLGYFQTVQNEISRLKSGDRLLVNRDGCKDAAGHFIIRFSAKFIEEIKKYDVRGFKPDKASVLFIVYWRKDIEKEVLIVLPEIYFEKKVI